MIFKHRSLQKELLDDFSLSGPALEKNLQNLSLVNQFLGGNQLIINGLSKILQAHPSLNQQNLRVADLGCGSGDILRVLAEWTKKQSLAWELLGIDANQVTIDYATEQSKLFNNIHYYKQNIFSAEFKQQTFDIILLCAVCHHFNDQELVTILTQLQQQARHAIIISDFHRHWLAYSATKLLSHICNCSYLEKHDGPLSIRKAFKREELIDLLTDSGVSHYQIQWCWPFRYQVLIYTKNFSSLRST